MLAAVTTRLDVLIVGRGEAPFIGISGRQMGSLEYGMEVSPLGQHGPYTIVHWNGRNGYVLTELLVTPERYEETLRGAAETVSDDDDDAKPAGWARVLLPWRRRAA